jgi:hypothetical protein
MDYACAEHGIHKAQMKVNTRYTGERGGQKKYPSCRFCNRLNFRTWELLNRQYNRDRANAWYAAKRAARQEAS